MTSSPRNELPIDPERGLGNVYSSEQLQSAVDIYSSSFNDSVPLELLTVAASTFRARELMSLLLDRVRTENPVRNWNEFTLSFLDSGDFREYY